MQLLTVGLHAALYIASFFKAHNLKTSDPSIFHACYLVFTLGWNDLVNHTLVTRVGQLPFARILRSRAIIADLTFFTLLHFDSDSWIIFARWMVVVLIFISNMQYCITIGNEFCEALEIYFFKIRSKNERSMNASS